MRALAWKTIAGVLLGLAAAEVVAEIYSCPGDDGVISYQDQPCAVPESENADGEAAADPPAEAEPRNTQTAADSPQTVAPIDAELVAVCKKRYRDEIDRLDAELATGVTADKLAEYREQARALSQQLSRCEHGGTNTASGGGRSEPAGRDL